MCGICAIITPYDVKLVDPSSPIRTPELSPDTDPTSTSAGDPTSTPSSNSGFDKDLANDGTTTRDSSHLNLYAASFKYKDARPRLVGSEPPYTEIQRPRSVSRSRPGSVVPRADEQGAHGLGLDEASEGNGVKDGDKRDPGEKSVWVDTARAESAAKNGQDPALSSMSSTAADVNHTQGPHASTEYRTRLENELLCSLETIAHRGPDGKGVWVGEDCRVALGHVRQVVARDLLAGSWLIGMHS